MKTITRYLLIGQARSGTTYTNQLIRNHPYVSSIGDEIKIEPLFGQGIKLFTHGSESDMEKEIGNRNIFDAVASIHKKENTKVIGFKVAIPDLRRAEILKNSLIRHFRDVKIIYVGRQNLIDQCGSLLLARKTKVWHSWNKGDNLSEKIFIKEDFFRRYGIESLLIRKVFEDLEKTHDVLRITYEEDVINNDGSLKNMIYDFLRLEQVPEAKEPKARKVSPEASKFIQNYNELIDISQEITDLVENGEVIEVPKVKVRESGKIRFIFKKILNSLRM